ncbi:hypothetical protein RKK42_26395 [Klebsiella pneumoniae]|nr:hypothetical protein [Klebsiella pneumoniae]
MEKNYECNMLTRKSDGKSLPVWYCQEKPAKDSTNQGWFVEYGAVAAPLPVCHPFMPASLSFLLPEDIHIRSAKKEAHVSLWE